MCLESLYFQENILQFHSTWIKCKLEVEEARHHANHHTLTSSLSCLKFLKRNFIVFLESWPDLHDLYSLQWYIYIYIIVVITNGMFYITMMIQVHHGMGLSIRLSLWCLKFLKRNFCKVDQSWHGINYWNQLQGYTCTCIDININRYTKSIVIYYNCGWSVKYERNYVWIWKIV